MIENLLFREIFKEETTGSQLAEAYAGAKEGIEYNKLYAINSRLAKLIAYHDVVTSADETITCVLEAIREYADSSFVLSEDNLDCLSEDEISVEVVNILFVLLQAELYSEDWFAERIIEAIGEATLSEDAEHLKALHLFC